MPLEFQPGTRWAYSAAAGFDVLSRIVEVASGMPIDRFVKQRIFDPLEMKDTTYIVPTGNPRLVKLYSRTPEGLRPANDPNFMNGVYFSGGGGLVSTATDYAQFALMLANGGELNGVRLLSPRLVELMGSVFAPDTLPGRPQRRELRPERARRQRSGRRATRSSPKAASAGAARSARTSGWIARRS